jgi:hypothetical protein
MEPPYISDPDTSSPEASLREEVDDASIGDRLIADDGSKNNSVIFCNSAKDISPTNQVQLISPFAQSVNRIWAPA